MKIGQVALKKPEVLDLSGAGDARRAELLRRFGECEFVAEEKLDGYHLVTKPGEAWLRNAKHNYWDVLPERIQQGVIAASKLEVPPGLRRLTRGGIWLAGELFITGGNASDVASAIRKKPDLKMRHRLAFSVFDFPQLRWTENYRQLRERVFRVRDALHSEAFRVPRMLACGVLRGLLQKAPTMLTNVEEGVVLKQKTPVVANAAWYKVKKTETLDLKLVAFVAGKGKYFGQVGALVGADRAGKLHQVSGITDAMRKSLGEDVFGDIFEVRHNGILARGGLRHARFVRWREDLEWGAGC